MFLSLNETYTKHISQGKLGDCDHGCGDRRVDESQALTSLKKCLAIIRTVQARKFYRNINAIQRKYLKHDFRNSPPSFYWFIVTSIIYITLSHTRSSNGSGTHLMYCKTDSPSHREI